jgi:proliferating cell nuclear antigen
MKVTITDKKKKEMFVSLFNVLKNCSSLINITFEFELLHIQGMDKSHICLFDVKINKSWFSSYEIVELTKICFDSCFFHSIISTKSDTQDLIIYINDNNEDILHIVFDSKEKETKNGETKNGETKKGEFKKTFKMNLVEYEYEEMNIPVVDYDAEFSLSTKLIFDIFSQLNNFGTDIVIKCSQEDISLTTNGSTGEMKVDIPMDDLNSYSIIEDEEITLTYSLAYINKMCITNKLSNDVDFSLSNECPMKISYNLGDDSSLVFFIAPKMDV